MNVYYSQADYQPGHRPVATIGTFDGVHVGHQVILDKVVSKAREIEGESVLITFDPHPRLVLFPKHNTLQLLQTLPERIALLESLGIDKLLVIPFDKAFSRLRSDEFVQQVLVDTVGVYHLQIGYDHRFGRNRDGDIELLRELGPQHGFTVEEIPAQSISDANVSSTKIRHALLAGDVKTAWRYLGRPYSFSGKVVRGEQKGRELGFPTANLEVDGKRKLIPADGVYVVEVDLPESGGQPGTKRRGLLSIGTKPTFAGRPRTVEVWLHDFSGNLYGQRLTVRLLKFLRAQEKFTDEASLREQMERDRGHVLDSA